VRKITKRILFFDVVRIAAVTAIVFWHMGLNLLDQPALFGVFDMRLGPVAVYVLLFVSGAVLQVSHPRSWEEPYLSFMERRLGRIYPAFWFALGLTMLFMWDTVTAARPVDVLISIAGLSGAVGQWSGVPGGFMYTTFWFVGLIIVLYLMFPVVSKEIQESPHVAMFTFAMVSLASMAWISATWVGPAVGIRWFPLCGLVWFALGIYLVRLGWYPKITYSNVVMSRLSEMTFYAFLIHMTPPFTWLLGKNNVFFLLATLVTAFWMMEIEMWIRRNTF